MIDWESVVAGNTTRGYGWAAVFFVVLVGLFWLLQKVVLWRVRRLTDKTATDIDDTLVRLIEKIRPPVFMVVALWVAVRTLTLTPLLRAIVDGATVAVLVYQTVITLQTLINFVIGRRLRRSAHESALLIVNKISAVVLWSVGILFVLSNFGINVTSLVAGLGIGGIAIALAAQNILGDLFSALAIYLDKPFAVGDFIITGDVMGQVTHVGIKTTRLRALSGEEIVLPNRDVTAARIRNLRRMRQRRVVFELGVAADTPAEVLRTIPDLIKKGVERVENTRFSAANLVKLDSSRFVFEVVYHVTDPDFDIYRGVQEKIVLEIVEECARASIAVVSVV